MILMEKTTTIRISTSTKKLLDTVKHKGQSYDGLLQELVLTIRQHEVRIHELEKAVRR
jgi:hypothetical protein